VQDSHRATINPAAWTQRFLDVAGDGECEIRQVNEPPA
jgi:hypothetical protein